MGTVVDIYVGQAVARGGDSAEMRVMSRHPRGWYVPGRVVLDGSGGRRGAAARRSEWIAGRESEGLVVKPVRSIGRDMLRRLWEAWFREGPAVRSADDAVGPCFVDWPAPLSEKRLMAAPDLAALGRKAVGRLCAEGRVTLAEPRP